MPRPFGESHYKAILTEDQVKRVIRQKHISATEFAHEFGVTAPCIRLIRTGQNWKHIPRERARARALTRKPTPKSKARGRKARGRVILTLGK
jgi:hypothetical protein